MPRQTTTFALMLPPRDAKMPARQWLYSALRVEILEGRLRPGARLPGTRDLAGQYGLSRGTIVSAFEQLQSEGYVEGSIGSGTYVSKVLPDELLKAPQQIAAHATSQSGSKRDVSYYAKRLSLNTTSTFDMLATCAFRTALHALDLFPTTLWTQIGTPPRSTS